jgi:hypothetical protein
MCYLRLDPPNSSGTLNLQVLRSFIAARFPIAFGFPVPCSLTRHPDVPYRPTFDAIRGGQAVLAVGYDDRHGASARGALLIRSSWGEGWGDGGYGWLPYRYVEQRLARDFWTLLCARWFDSGELACPFPSAS